MIPPLPQHSDERFRQVGRQGRKRGGQALVEFAIISFVLSGIVAGMLGIMVLALGSFQNNIAAENAGRILDRHQRLSPAAFQERFDDETINPYTATSSQVMELLTSDDTDFTSDFGQPLYHERHLVLSPEEWASSANLPVLNRHLLPSYIYDPDVNPECESILPEPLDDAPTLGAYRYPGAVVKRTVDGDCYKTVLIPLLNAEGVQPCHDGDCRCESEHWVAPIRVCKIQDCDCDSDPPDVLTPIGSQPTFMLSIVYPSQPGSMLYIERDKPENEFRQTPVVADDDAVSSKYASELSNPPTGYDFDDPTPNADFGASPNRGRYGLGESYAFNTVLRPYRAVFESRSAFRLRFDSIAAQYHADPLPTSSVTIFDAANDQHTTNTAQPPFEVFENNRDQFLDLPAREIDRQPDEIRLMQISDPVNANDFLDRVLVVPSNGAGTWHVNVAAQFDTESWVNGHEFELRLYRNGERERLLAQHRVSAANTDPVQLIGEGVIEADVGDHLQVRIYMAHPIPADAFNAELTNEPENNWISFHFSSD